MRRWVACKSLWRLAICLGARWIIFTTYLHQLEVFDSVQIAILKVVTAAMMLLMLLPSFVDVY